MLFSQNVNVKIKTSISNFGKKSEDNQTVFYDATNYPFIKEVAVKLKKDSVISIPKGNYIIKADYPDYVFGFATGDYYYPRHFLSERKSLWDATIFKIESDTTLTEILANPITEFNSDGTNTRFFVLNDSKDTIKTLVLTVYQSVTSKTNPYIYHSSAMFNKSSGAYQMISKESSKNYLYLFDYNAEYLPGYIAPDSTITQDFSKAKLFSNLKNYAKHTIKMEKVVPPNGEFKIRGILDSTILQIIHKPENELQSKMPIKWGIVVAYNENNQPAGFAFTDSEGKFEIGKLTSGKYSIKASYLSMQKVVATEIDNSGNTKELNISLDIPNENDELKLYPNPTNGFCKLYLKLPQASINTIKITDLNGNELFNIKTELSDIIDYNLDLNEYANGVYNLIIQNEINTITRKVIKN